MNMSVSDPNSPHPSAPSASSSPSSSSSSSSSEPTVPLTVALVRSLTISKVFKDTSHPVTSVDFDDAGDLCVTSAQDESIQLYDCRGGRQLKTLFSKKYGVHLARFTHRSTNIVYASTKEDDTLRYLSLHDNKYIRYFKGHKDKVVALQMSPLDDQFMSGSLDGTVRLWDLRTAACQGCMNLPEGRPVIAFDQTGLCYAIAINSNTILMYDLKNYDKGPFNVWTIPEHPHRGRHPKGNQRSEWTSMEFTNDGKYLVIGTSNDTILVVDAYDGDLRQRLVGHTSVDMKVGPQGRGSDVTITPDGRFVMAGCQNGRICAWDLTAKPENRQHPYPDVQPVHIFEAHTAPVRAIGFNRKYMMMLSACSEVALWTPDYTNASSFP